jgi:hypothetical protein
MGILSSGSNNYQQNLETIDSFGKSTSNSNNSATAAATEASSEKSSAEAEVSSYLDNKRGKIGTIKTSWQGLLEENQTQPKRKTLLGE